jgi:hypothetical protein
MSYKVTSFQLKLALLEYYRFQRQWIAVDEFNGADVICNTGKKVIEVEVKVAKHDLCYAEKRKLKHHAYRDGRQYGRCHPNEYFFCVPDRLQDEAIKVIEELNPSYGLFLFYDEHLLNHIERFGRIGELHDYLSCVRRAKKLHIGYPAKQVEHIAKRCCAKNITQMQIQHKELLEEKNDSETN